MDSERDIEAREGMDHDPRRSLAAWDELPQVAEEIGERSSVGRIAYLHERALEEARLRRVRARFKSGDPADDQPTRYALLEQLVHDYRPPIQDLKEYSRRTGAPVARTQVATEALLGR